MVQLTRLAWRRFLIPAGMVLSFSVGGVLGYGLRETSAPPSPPESIGARLQSECASIIDAAGGAAVSQVDVARLLERRPEIAEEIRKRGIPDWDYSKKVHLLLAHPAWASGLREALGEKRERMIQQCVLRRGTRQD